MAPSVLFGFECYCCTIPPKQIHRLVSKLVISIFRQIRITQKNKISFQLSLYDFSAADTVSLFYFILFVGVKTLKCKPKVKMITEVHILFKK